MALLIGIYQGGSYGGAISATVVGIPGTPMAAATLLDARPMALSGRASEAVTLSTIGSSVGSMVSGFALILIAPALAAIAIRFGPAEMFGFALLGLTALGALGQGSTLKAWLMGFLGLWLSTIGRDPVTGVARFAFDSVYFESGITLIPLLVGLFGISELLVQANAQARAHDAGGKVSTSIRAFKTLASRAFNYLRSSVIGTFVGILPAIGGVTASFLAYRIEMFFTTSKEKFGQGNPDGVIASETANSAVTGGALIPMLALGIPGDPIVAVLMGGLLMQGITAGPTMFLNHADVVQGLFVVFILGAVLLLPMGLMFLRAVVAVLRLPQWLILTGVILAALVGTYAVQRQVFDLYLLIGFGVIGYGLRVLGFPLAPIVVGFVLGPVCEINFRRMMLVSQGEVVEHLSGRPIALVVFGLVAMVVVYPLVRMVWMRRRPPTRVSEVPV